MPGVNAHDVLQLMILGQYMDTLKDVGGLLPSLVLTCYVFCDATLCMCSVERGGCASFIPEPLVLVQAWFGAIVPCMCLQYDGRFRPSPDGVREMLLAAVCGKCHDIR